MLHLKSFLHPYKCCPSKLSAADIHYTAVNQLLEGWKWCPNFQNTCGHKEQTLHTIHYSFEPEVSRFEGCVEEEKPFLSKWHRGFCAE